MYLYAVNLEIPLSRPILGHITVMFEDANSHKSFQTMLNDI